MASSEIQKLLIMVAYAGTSYQDVFPYYILIVLQYSNVRLTLLDTLLQVVLITLLLPSYYVD